jgi:parallel beta-helix repeat protein
MLRMTAIPNTLPSDGSATSTLVITVTDAYGHVVADGTMVGVTTTLGSLPCTYTEAENAAVTKMGAWATLASGSASGGSYIRSVNFGDEVTWAFQGTAVSLVYRTASTGGVADASVDGTYVATLSFVSSGTTWQVERVLASNLAPGVHTVRIRNGGVGPIWLDAFRSGVKTTGGVAMAMLTAPNTIGTASVRALALQPGVSRLTADWPFTVTTVAFPGPSEVWVDDDFCAACSNGGHLWNYDAFKTIQGGVDKVLSGGTVHVAAGTYTESVSINAKSVSVLGAGSNAAILNGVNDLPANHGFHVTSAADVTITGFKIKDFGVGIYLGVVSNASITQNKFESNGNASNTYALHGVSVADSTLCSNEVTLGYNGFFLDTVSGTTICYNQIHANKGFGVKIDVGNDNSIDNNNIYDNQNVGIELVNLTTNNGVFSNVLHDLWWDGVLVNGSGLSTVHIGANVISRTNLAWLDASSAAPDANHNLGGIVLIGATDSDITDNRITNVSNAEGSRVNAAGIYLKNNTAPISIETNLIQGCTGHGIYFPPGGGSPTIHGNSIFSNGRFGLNNSGAALLQAQGNWWGRNTPTAGPAEPNDILNIATVFWSPPISLTLGAAPTEIDANGLATSNITATASGGGYNILDGTYITFSSNLNTLVLPGSSVFAGGQANTILRAGTIAGVATITGTAEPGIEGQTCTVTLRALGPWSVSIVANPSSVAVGGSQAVVTATVLDVHSNPVPGRLITFTSNALGAVSPGSSSTSAAGEAATTFTSGGIIGTARVTATASITLSAAVNIPVTAGPVCTGSMTLNAVPAALLANGVATSSLTVQMSDCLANPVVDGTMVGFTTTLGTIIDYAYVEAESASVVTSTGWIVNNFLGVYYIETATPGSAAFWDFRGPAVSLIYRSGPAGLMRVRVDGGVPVDIDTFAAVHTWKERVIANNLDPNVLHQIEVAYESGTIMVDAFRSGAVTTGGQAKAILRAPVLAITDTGTVWATSRIGHSTWPTLQVTTTVVFSQTNVVWVDDDYCPLCPNGGHVWGSDAFSNIPDGVMAVRSPGTVFVAGGTYTLPVNITKTLNLLGAGAAETFVEGYGLLTPAITVTNVSNVVMRNFTVQNWATGINISGGPSTGLEVSNNVFSNCVTLAVSGVFVNSSTFANNVIQNSDGRGIELDTLSGVTLRENQIRDISGTGIKIFSSIASPCIGNQISYNIIERLNDDGIWVGTTCSNTLVLSNTVRSTNRNLVGGGIVLSGPVDFTVEHNLITEVSNAGGSFNTAGIRITGNSKGGNIRYNRIIGNVNDGVALIGFNTPPTVTCNLIYGNGRYGLVNYFGTPVNAVGNWWGHSIPTGVVGPPPPPPPPFDIGFVGAPLNVIWSPPITLSLTPAALTVTVDSPSMLVTVTACGGGCCIVDGTPLTITTSLGTFGSPPTATVQGTFSGGSAKFWFNPGVIAGTAYLTATTPYDGQVTGVITITPGAPAYIDLVVSDNTLGVGVGPASQTALKAYVYDFWDNWVTDGTTITFGTTLGAITPTVAGTVGGLAQTTFYAGTMPGVALVSASWGFVVDTQPIYIQAGPPNTISSIVANPTEILANCFDTSIITATVRDQYGNLVPDSTMVAFWTSAGSMIYGFSEAEGPAVSKAGFVVTPDGTASAGAYIGSSTVGAQARWDFRGEAVLIGYRRFPAGGTMRVVIGGSSVDIDTSGPAAWLEEAMPIVADPTITQTVEVNVLNGTIRLDFFRSGARTVAGRAVATLTAACTSGTATVSAYAIGGTYPLATVNVQFLDPLDVWVDDNYCPACANDGHQWGFDAFSNIPAGVARVRVGGTVHVLDGTYTQTVTISKRMHLDGAGSATTSYIIGSGTGDGIHVNAAADGTTIEGFNIQNWKYGINLDGRLANRLQGITVTNVAIEECASGGGITATFVNNGYIADNVIHNDNGFGFDLNMGDNNTIIGNHIYDNNGWGIRVFGILVATNNTHIYQNNIHDVNWNGIHVGQGSVGTRVMTNTVSTTNRTVSGDPGQNMGGISMFDTSDTRVEGNTVSYVQNESGASFDTAGVALDGSGLPTANQGAVIMNNMIRNNVNNGIFVSNDGYPAASVPQIHGNSIICNDRFGYYSRNVAAAADGIGNWWGRNTPTIGNLAVKDIYPR